MPGAVGAIMGARRARKAGGSVAYNPTPMSDAEKRRLQASIAELRLKAKLKKIINQYDTNKSGKLERDQIVKYLTDHDSSTPPGTAPTDEQVDFLIKVSDKDGAEAVTVDELGELIAVWHTFVEHRLEFEDKLKKYDTSKTGKLSKDELKNYLTDLNGGKPVTPEEVDMFMKGADVIGDGELNNLELQRATALWFTYVEEQKSSCCSIL